MGRTREKFPSRRMKPVFLVFCEGETEEIYLDFIRKTFRSPIKIISKVEGSDISSKLVNSRKKELKISPAEQIRVFLMYDMDVPAVTDKLFECQAEMLLSNPCLEIWYLLHCKDQRGSVTSEKTIIALKAAGGVWAKYEKASLTETQKAFLRDNLDIAVSRAKSLIMPNNPSTGIYKLIEALKES